MRISLIFAHKQLTSHLAVECEMPIVIADKVLSVGTKMYREEAEEAFSARERGKQKAEAVSKWCRHRSHPSNPDGRRREMLPCGALPQSI